MYVSSPASHPHTSHSHCPVPSRLWFTGHFTPSWGGHLQCWPCTAAQRRRYSIWQHYPQQSPSSDCNRAVNLHYEGFYSAAWRSKMLLSYRSVPSLLFPILNDTAGWSALQHALLKSCCNCVCSFSQCLGIGNLQEAVRGIQVTITNGIWTKRQWNKSIPQQGRQTRLYLEHVSVCSIDRLLCGYVITKTTCGKSWLRKLWTIVWKATYRLAVSV